MRLFRRYNVVSYRFCRPDDIPLLTDYVNRCCTPEPALTVEDFKREVRQLNVWCSSCMIASEGTDPVGVLIGAKRPDSNLVYRLGVRPEFRRQGHAAHMLESLKQKLIKLGPPDIYAELPTEMTEALACFEKQGYQHVQTLIDYELVIPLEPISPENQTLIENPPLDELLEHFSPLDQLSWLRSKTALQNCADSLSVHAIASMERVEACLIAKPAPLEGTHELLGLRVHDPVEASFYLEILLRSFCQPTRLPVRIPRLSPHEVSPSFLEKFGFKRHGEYIQLHLLAKA